MQILVLLLIVGCVLHFYGKNFHIFLGFLMIDWVPFLRHMIQFCGFGCWFLAFGRFPQVCNNLGLLLMLGLGIIKVFPCAHRFKGLLQFFRESSVVRDGFYSRSDVDQVYRTNIWSCKGFALKLLMNSDPQRIDNLVKESKEGVVNDEVSEEIEDEGGEKECQVEDDVIELRRLIEVERKRARVAVRELEKERVAAASAVDELMAKILCLETEKNSIEIRSNQYRRMAELKQQYDDEVIRYLKWVITNLLEFDGEELEWQGRDKAMDGCGGDNGCDDVLISSLQRELSAPLL